MNLLGSSCSEKFVGWGLDLSRPLKALYTLNMLPAGITV